MTDTNDDTDYPTMMGEHVEIAGYTSQPGNFTVVVPTDSIASFPVVHTGYDMLHAIIEFMERADQVGEPLAANMNNTAARDARFAMLWSEIEEFRRGENADDIAEIVDGLIDIAYVSLGSVVSYIGTELAKQCVAEVIRTNLAKVVGPGLPIKNDVGKVMKPEGWTPPNIPALLGKYLPQPLPYGTGCATCDGGGCGDCVER